MLKQEGYDFMRAAFEVYNELKGGLFEEIYQESLEKELAMQSIPYQSKKKLKVFYKKHELNKSYIPDLYVFNAIIVELKSVSQLCDEHRAQLLNYMRITKTKVGYLVNFGHMNELEWERYVI